jgi:hypothetical protein
VVGLLSPVAELSYPVLMLAGYLLTEETPARHLTHIRGISQLLSTFIACFFGGGNLIDFVSLDIEARRTNEGKDANARC